MKRPKKDEKKGPNGPFFSKTCDISLKVKHHPERLYPHRLTHK